MTLGSIRSPITFRGFSPPLLRLSACPRSNRNLPSRPLDDLDQHLLALFDAEMAIMPIELVAVSVEVADRSGPLKVDLDAFAHFLEGNENFVDFLAWGIVNRRNLLRVYQRVRALSFLHCQRQRTDLIVRVAGEQIERVLVGRAHQLLEFLVARASERRGRLKMLDTFRDVRSDRLDELSFGV